MTRYRDTSSRGGYDDLTVIKGIGALTQDWLRAVFAVRTYADLAALSPDVIEERLRADGKITARSRIEEWLVQAQQLSAPAAPLDMPDVGVHDASAWKTYAQFVIVIETRQEADEVEFRTKAHHMEADRGQMWPGITAAEPGRWMADQMGLPEEVAPAPAPPEYVQPELIQSELVPLELPLERAPLPAEPSLYSEALERHIAKVRELDRRAHAGAPSAAIPELSYPVWKPYTPPEGAGLFSAELERHIAKARELEERAQSARVPSRREQEPRTPPEAAGLYSAELERHIEKAWRLSGKS